ncbi:MAG: RNA polymerase sigma factor [Thermoanaerobaculales bacterium]
MSGDACVPLAMVEEFLGEDRVADEAGPLRTAFDALVAGDLDALGAIYDTAAHELFGIALWRTGSREDAADVVQDVFVRLARAGSKLTKVRNPRAYLLTMAHRAAIDVVRQRRRSEPVDDALLEPVVPDHASILDAARLSALVRALPAGQREAVYLRHFAGLSFAEIGAATRVPTFTAASRCRLGLARLRKLLGVEK